MYGVLRSTCRNKGASGARLRYLCYSCTLGAQRRGVLNLVSRLEQTLNKPIVVLVVGVLAVALNVLLYFGVFLPRMTPLIAHINPIGTSPPEPISKSGPEGSLESETASPPHSPSGSPPVPPHPQSSAPPHSPSGSLPELPPPPQEQQYLP